MSGFRLKQRGAYWYVVGYSKGKEILVSTRKTNQDDAEKVAAAVWDRALRRVAVGRRAAKIFPGTRSSYEPGDNKWEYYLLRRAKDRAARRGIACTLTADHIKAMIQRAAGRCEVTGIPFVFESGGAWLPTLDRIDAAGGYTPRNCRLVCNCVNAAMGRWGEGVLQTIAEAVHSLSLETESAR